ncbi:MAG: ATP-binding cassette domain-containing protein [Polyangiaceae bacterium]
MLEVQGIKKSYPAHDGGPNGSRSPGESALAATTLSFEAGSTTVLIGPSGCGKSTLLRIVLGLVEPDEGRVLFDGEALTRENAEVLRRRTGYVLQEGGLFPHLTAKKNVSLLADVLGRPEATSAARIAKLAELVRLPLQILSAFPHDLSGGERQRVSLMRALMLDPEWVLLDEPLGALDPITRRALQSELRDIFARLKKTVILVTHDMGEAAYFGDVIVLMRKGKIVQRGTARELLESPAEPFVSEFIRAQRSPLDDLAESSP